MPLPRIQYALPRTLQARLGIAKAICKLAEQEKTERLEKQEEVIALPSVQEIAAQFAGEVCNELRKAGYNPDQPRVPAGNSDGGQWTSEDGSAPSATPESDAVGGRQYTANEQPGIGHN